MKKLAIITTLSLSVLFMSCENRQSAVQEDTNAAKEVAAPKSDNAMAEENAPKVFAQFNFEETEYDFGPINHGDVVEHVFPFTNTGEAPLVITDIRTTCGCTTPEYTKEPVQPGETGEITVRFNSRGKSGVINKRVTIYANTESGTSFLNIKTVVNTQKEIEGPFKNQPAS